MTAVLVPARRARTLARMGRILTSLVLAIVLNVSLGGCDLAGTGAAAAGAAAAAAQQAEQGRKTEEHVKEQVDAAYEQAAQRRQAAESDTR